MEELKEEVGVKDSFKRKLVGSRLKWAGHVERIEGKINEESGCAQSEGRRRRRRRPILGWEEVVNRYLEG